MSSSMIARMFAIVLTASASQPPIPDPSIAGQKLQAKTADKGQRRNPNQTAAPQSASATNLPIAAQSQQIAANAGNQGQKETSEDWRIVLFTGILTIVAVLQWIAMLSQSKHMRDGLKLTRQSVDKMDEVATGQSVDMRASITEATRAAKAMEGIAQSLATNVTQLQDALAVNKRIADTNEQSLHVLNQQWLEVGSWTGKLIDFATDGSHFKRGLAISFSLSNPSTMPVTMTNVTVGFRNGQPPLVTDLRGILAPRHSWILTGPFFPFESPEHERAYAEDQMSLPSYVAVEFVDAFGEPRHQDFNHVCIFGPNTQTAVPIPTLLHPDFEKHNQAEPQGQPEQHDQPQSDELGLSSRVWQRAPVTRGDERSRPRG